MGFNSDFGTRGNLRGKGLDFIFLNPAIRVSGGGEFGEGAVVDGSYTVSKYKATTSFEKEQTEVKWSAIRSFMNPKYYTDYKGQNTANSIDPSKIGGDDPSNINLAHLIQWSETKPAVRLRWSNFVYLRDLGLYPNNRIKILRRYVHPTADTISSTWGEPISTMITWVDPADASMVDFTFGEKWTEVSDTIYKVINDMLDEGLANAPGPVKTAMDMFKGSDKGDQSNKGKGWLEGVAIEIGKYLGVYTGNDIQPEGNPNIIQQASIRQTGGSGIHSTITYNFKTAFEMKYIDGIDPSMAYIEIMQEILRMGGSKSQFIFTGQFGNRIKKINDLIAKGNMSELIKIIIDSVMGAISKLVDMVKEVFQAVATAVTSAASGDFGAIENLVNKFLQMTLGNIARLYRIRLEGAIAAMTGAPTGPWHLTIGNPKKPVLSVGNLVCDSVTVNVGNVLSYDDVPTTIEVTYGLKDGRSRGIQEIMRLFNNDSFRQYDLPPNSPGDVPAESLPAGAGSNFGNEFSDSGKKETADYEALKKKE
jgi:hypothetical protein